MKVTDALLKLKFVPQYKLLELYPPFLFMGVKIKSVSKNHRKLHATLPLRWYGTNLHGTMFGGFMCALTDPLPALLCEKIFPNTETWTKKNSVDFLRPGKGLLHLHIEITEADVEQIQKSLDEHGKAKHTFEFYYQDSKHEKIAHIHNTVFLKKRQK